ncbi:hypothetical protein EV356DRAFT_515129 [Viridothelium virens]|uniref:Uncharacterized protein n=1 Tax=Viridothelium virens TaxID=1048519 RepID=A0A6A6HAC2_VIRVR|nr:hypothetical protein EV356DRAFT_515129 [Viridothelium virens]
MFDQSKILDPRQAFVSCNPEFDDCDGHVSWWFSTTAIIIKWAILGGLFLAFFSYLLIGYIHARRRIKKNLPPLRYHRWMVSRYTDRPSMQNPHPPPQRQYNSATDPNSYYGNFNAPPAYNSDSPPLYQPPSNTQKPAQAQDQDLEMQSPSSRQPNTSSTGATAAGKVAQPVKALWTKGSNALQGLKRK